MNDVVVRAELLGKQYHIGARQKTHKNLRETLVDTFASPLRRAGKLLLDQTAVVAELSEVIWVLREISFEIRHGEIVGMIGRKDVQPSTFDRRGHHG